MKKLLLLMLWVFFFSSCDEKVKVSGHRVEESHEISGYEKIEVSSEFTVEFRNGEQNEIVVKTFSSVLPYVKTYIQDGTLYVELEKNIRFDENPNVIVTIPTSGIGSLNLREGVTANCKEQSIFATDGVVMEVSGGSSFTGDIMCDNLTLAIRGGSKVHFNGEIGNSIVECSEGSNFDFKSKGTSRLSMNLSGGSKAYVMVNEIINSANISGGSKFYYDGTRIVNNVNCSGDSDIIFGFK